MLRSLPSGLCATNFLLFSFISVGGFSGCSAKELTRSQAESLIKDSTDFKYPVVTQVKRANEDEPLLREKISNSEKMEESKVEDLKGYWRSDSQLAVLNHLGLINIEQTFTREEPGMGQHIKPARYFVTKFRINDKGKVYWKDTGSGFTDESIPVAVRKFAGIFGITRQGETQAVAEFSYELMPNELGKTFDPSSVEFKALPTELQQEITGVSGTPPADKRADWTGARKGKGFFQKYDDGWRLMKILVFDSEKFNIASDNK